VDLVAEVNYDSDYSIGAIVYLVWLDYEDDLYDALWHT